MLFRSRIMASSATGLRERGFRRVSPGFQEPGSLARFAQEFGYQFLQDDASLWLRRSSMVMVLCSRSGPVRCRACNLAIAVAVQAEVPSRVQPQEHVMRQRDRPSLARVDS